VIQIITSRTTITITKMITLPQINSNEGAPLEKKRNPLPPIKQLITLLIIIIDDSQQSRNRKIIIGTMAQLVDIILSMQMSMLQKRRGN
jgi:hypothetical protein